MKWARATALGLGCLMASACFIPRESASSEGDQVCTKCHGDSQREGSALERSAPPFDIFGNTSPEYPGVGAHTLHLKAGPTHAAVPCSECHRVPERASDEGHNVGTTQIHFGPTATRDGGLQPTYDFATQRCSNSGCHGAQSGVWSRPREEGEKCGVCHGLPPARPHPQAGACAVCHPTVGVDGGFVSPYLHVNGFVDVGPAACDSCHGMGEFGAPPRALDGGVDRANVGVGAHQAHLNGGASTAPVPCATCHLVPSSYVTAKHPNGGRAEVRPFERGVWNPSTATCFTSCHGGTSPVWTSTDARLNCTSCHGMPPPAPHPQVTNCALCHPNQTGALGRTVVDRTQHVNGTVEATVSAQCDACHGSPANPAPPRDTKGQTATTLPSVGAHQAHVVGRGLARAVPCGECHRVPTQTVSTGHLNGVVEVVFSGVAKANLASPMYANGSCANSACHDISNYTVAPGGGSATTPNWTQVDGSQMTCTSCHGMPPPEPHPQRSDCKTCHSNVTPLQTFFNPELHVNGHVDF